MNETLPSILIFITSFVTVWIGAGLIVLSVGKISRKLRVPSFLISFVILGILTSTPEIAVGLSAVSSNSPAIFVGNLLGGVPVIFLFVIPLLAIFGKGIRLNHNLDQVSLVLPLLVAIAPFAIVLDQKVTNYEAVGLILIYIGAVYLLESKDRVLKNKDTKLLKIKSYSFIDIVKVLAGTGMVLFSSNIIVSKSLYFSEILNIAPFYMGLIVLSLGTNLPEITLAFRSIVSGKKEVAFGDYLGSAAANALLFGIFALLTPNATLVVDNYLTMFVIMGIGMLLFYYFSKTKRTISPKEGGLLFCIYIIFVVVELVV